MMIFSNWNGYMKKIISYSSIDSIMMFANLNGFRKILIAIFANG